MSNLISYPFSFSHCSILGAMDYYMLYATALFVLFFFFLLPFIFSCHWFYEDFVKDEPHKKDTMNWEKKHVLRIKPQYINRSIFMFMVKKKREIIGEKSRCGLLNADEVQCFYQMLVCFFPIIPPNKQKQKFILSDWFFCCCMFQHKRTKWHLQWKALTCLMMRSIIG